MNFIYTFPEKAAYGSTIAKSRLFENATIAPRIRTLISKTIDQIIWEYKLAPETINLASKLHVCEIQVITLMLKTDTISEQVLLSIDRSIPSPVLFTLSFNNAIAYRMAYKRPAENDVAKNVVSTYFTTGWIKRTAAIKPLPVAADLMGLYVLLLQSISGIASNDGEQIEPYVERLAAIDKKEREIDDIKNRIRTEPQFNKKVTLNQMLRQLEKELGVMRGPARQH